VNEGIRRDEIYWLERPHAEFEELRLLLNRDLFLGLRSLESHYAYYPPGGFYRRHVDRFRADDARTVSFILYLNENWKPADGGRLRLYLKNEEVDIDPVGGTLVCFMSGEIEHEVLESRAPRFSYTGWMKT
jgi:SM-20-related protein